MLQSRSTIAYKLVVFIQGLILFAIVVRYKSDWGAVYPPNPTTPTEDRVEQRDVPTYAQHRLTDPMAKIYSERRRLGCQDYQEERDDSRPAGVSYKYMEPPPFLPDYKNPCWWSDSHRKNLSCLPYFYIAGVQKCGTSDLAFRVSLHPLVVNGREKEPRYLDKRMYNSKCLTEHSSVKDKTRCAVQEYASTYYDIASESIQKNEKVPGVMLDRWKNNIHRKFQDEWRNMTQREPTFTKGQHEMITYDSTPKTLFNDGKWQEIVENRGCPEPVVLLPHMVSRLNPHAKIIVLLRDPTDRLLSGYMFFNKMKEISPQHFHDWATRAIAEFTRCQKKRPDRICLNQNDEFNVRLWVGLYHKYLEEWFRHFPRSQFLFIQSESYNNDIPGTLEKVFHFLNLPPVSDAALKAMGSLQQKNTNKVGKKKMTNMLPKTRAMLRKFYQKYNERLAEMLNDERFAWRDKAE